VAVGINPHGPEWTILAKYLSGCSDDIFCGDFSNYDGTLHAQIMWSVLDIVNEWYHDGPENALIRQVLFSDIVYAFHLSGNQVYAMDHGNPSGNPLTAILNSLYQLVASYYILLETGKTIVDIKERFRIVTYGDDNITAVNGGSDFLDLTEFTEAFTAHIGMTLTNASKNGSIAYITLDEADFLSRSFRFEDGIYYAPRPWENLSLVFNYIKSREPWDQLLLSYTESCCYELSHYPEELFLKYTQKIDSWCLDHNMVPGPVYPLLFYRSSLQKWVGSGKSLLLCWGI
jgi:hypothetical protein